MIKAKKRLHIAGGRSFYPSLRLKNYGFVDQIEKLELLRRCDALLFPVLWPEPFGLVAIEAMSQGIPVIGTPYGALAEIITPTTGLFVHNLTELTSVLKNETLNNFNKENK